MSLAYQRAAEVLSKTPRWEADEGDYKIVIYLDRDNIYCVTKIDNADPPFIHDIIDNSLWFKTVESAKRYAKNEMYVKARFRKIIK